MKLLSPLFLLSSLAMFSVPVFAEDASPPSMGCAAKSQEIRSKIQQAKTDGDKDQQAGLEKALSEANANCSETSLLKQREQKVLDAKREVTRRQNDLTKAMEKGDAQKINKRKEKLADSRKELQEAQTELEKIQPED
ncbi:(p)ppGpp synthase/HD superfamily hydrolase [Pseudomonas sp. JUb42]|jgi:hypothetical protein|nr:DUF1090 domain-containing protein [Pseudomonas sp. JUb42]MCS3468049.1 (p)ppGpp synthase/HD superfamily hydrolase [Pseudomonas sp. JUb42]